MKKSLILFFVMIFVFLCSPYARSDFSTPATNLTNNSNSSGHPKIARMSGTGNIFVIYTEDQLLYFARSTDGGINWEARQQLTTWGETLEGSSYGNYRSIAIAVEEPYVHVVMMWRSDDLDDFEILYRRNTNYGNSSDWGSWVYLSNSSTDSTHPDVAARGEYVHVTYEDSWPGNDEIMYKRITNYGAGSVDQTRRLTFSVAPSKYPSIAVSKTGYTVHIAYSDAFSGSFQICYKHINDYGAGSYQTYQLTFGAYCSSLPDIAASTGTDDQYVYIVYQDSWPGNIEIMYKRLDSYGNPGFSQVMHRLTYSSTNSYLASVDFDGAYNNVHISYHDNWPGNNDVFHKKLSNYGGAGFSTNRVSWGTGLSAYATIAASGVWAYIVWMDNSSSGYYDIFVKKGY